MKCERCNSRLASRAIGLCAECLRDGIDEASVERIHGPTRREFALPERIPRDQGPTCRLCANECRIGPGGKGYCGLRQNRDGRLVSLGGTPKRGWVQWYYDPLPTNCVASWVCPEGEGRRSSVLRTRPAPANNLAVFYEACTFNCLFCQNWTYRLAQHSPHELSAEQLAARADEHTACICFFGGDPGAQMSHALRTAEIALARRDGKLRICWETNGNANPKLLRRAAEVSLHSGGCVKFDLKAFDENLHRALTGVSNRRTLANFEMVAGMRKQRSEPPLLVASTLLVPAYLDDKEIASLARFIASIDPEIPYSLLGFHPDFYMSDLPMTSRRHAERAEAICREAGLRNVNIGNRHILGSAVY